MRFESVILAWAVLPALAILAWRTRRFEPAGRWLTRCGAILLGLAAMGVQMRCDRPLRIAVMVDYSPSTRGAQFRDEARLNHRLNVLLGNRPRWITYFADGLIPGPAEVAAVQTRLPETNADAVLIFSDGRFESVGALPAVFAVVDPGLEQASDARVERMQIVEGIAKVGVHADTSGRFLNLESVESAIAHGDTVVSAKASDRNVTARITPGDLWPENDQLRTTTAMDLQRPVWMVDRADTLPNDLTAYINPAAIVLTDPNVSLVQQRRLTEYVRELGGTLILAGAPSDFPVSLRRIAPLRPNPPRSGIRWTILLDSSGSMASRWEQAIAAARDAVSGLDDDARITMIRFSREAEVLITNATPAEASARIESLRKTEPSGPTGLDAALHSIVNSPNTGRQQLLLISDSDAKITDREVLADRLRQSSISLFLLNIGSRADASELKTLCQETGGAVIVESDARLWARRLLNELTGGTDDGVADHGSIVTRENLAGLRLEPSLRYRAFLREHATTLATQSEQPVAAHWRVGSGSVASLAIKLDNSSLQTIAERLKRPPIDPRFEVNWNVDRVRVRAIDNAQPMNRLKLMLNGTTLIQTAPGEYAARLDRRETPSIGQIVLDQQIIDMRVLEGQYPQEFDRIGNDRVALENLAITTGGRLVLPEEIAIDLPKPTEFRSLESLFGAFGFVFLTAGVVFIRAPYLTDRIRLRFRRK